MNDLTNQFRQGALTLAQFLTLIAQRTDDAHASEALYALLDIDPVHERLDFGVRPPSDIRQTQTRWEIFTPESSATGPQGEDPSGDVSGLA